MGRREENHLTLPLWGFDPQHPCSVLRPGWGGSSKTQPGLKVGGFHPLPSCREPITALCPKAGGTQSWSVPGAQSSSPGAQHSRAGPWLSPEPTNMDKEVSLIDFSFLFLLSFIATAPGSSQGGLEGLT